MSEHQWKNDEGGLVRCILCRAFKSNGFGRKPGDVAWWGFDGEYAGNEKYGFKSLNCDEEILKRVLL